MKRRDFLLGAAAALLFPSDAFASTITRTERTFGRKIQNELTETLPSQPKILEPPPIAPNDFVVFTNDTAKREVTNEIVVHHTGTSKDTDMSAREAHLLHKYKFEWAGIGYHYVIRKDGTIEAGRPENLVGAHSYGHNSYSVGIALSGDFDVGYATDFQMSSLISLCVYLADKYNLNLKKFGTLLGHRDLNDVTCPGEHFYPLLDYVRENAV